MGASQSGGLRRSVVLSCGQPLCEAAENLLATQPCILPAAKKFKFSEKLNSLQNELRRILINQSNGMGSIFKKLTLRRPLRKKLRFY